MGIDRVEYRKILEKAYRSENLDTKQLAIVALNPIDKVSRILLQEQDGILRYKILWENSGISCLGKVDVDI